MKIERQEMELERQKHLLEKKELLEDERNRIAAEMHDDLGSGLTTIKFLSDSVKAEDAADPIVHEIQNQARGLLENMSEIIWAMNSRYDSMDDLVSYLRRYAVDFLEKHQKQLVFQSDIGAVPLELTGEKRRNIFLVIKELLHMHKLCQILSK